MGILRQCPSYVQTGTRHPFNTHLFRICLGEEEEDDDVLTSSYEHVAAVGATKIVVL
jgi:hypothetical protein